MRRLVIPVAAALVAALVAACAPPTGEVPVALRVLMAEDWASTDAVIDVVRAFEVAHPDTTVSITPRPFNQIPAEVAAARARGAPYDVVHHHAFAGGAVGLATALDRWWQDGTFDVADYPAGAIADVRWGAGMYGVPLDLNALLLVHDPALPPPRTFAEVRAAAVDAAEGGRRGLTVSANAWEVYGWIRANGGEVVEVAEDGTPTFLLDTPAVVDALGFLGDLVVDELAFGPTTRNVSADAFELFAAGDTTMLTTGTWNVVALERLHPDRGHATATMPAGPMADGPGSALGGSSLYVGAGSTDIDRAVAFIAALTADDVARRLATEEGRLPARQAVVDRLPPTAWSATYVEQVASAHPMLLIAFPEAEAAFAAAIDDVLTGRMPAADALAEAQAMAVDAHGSP